MFLDSLGLKVTLANLVTALLEFPEKRDCLEFLANLDDKVLLVPKDWTVLLVSPASRVIL